MAARKWTQEQRARQSELVHRWMPWKQSTGAKTTQGKAVSSQNVKVGQRKKRAAIMQAQQELAEAQMKLRKLTANRGEWWDS